MTKQELELLEEQKRALWTEENVQRKIAAHFPHDKPDTVLAILNDAGELSGPRLSLTILWLSERMGNAGSLEYIQNLAQTARGDYRDILMFEYPRELEVPLSTPSEELRRLEAEDVRDYIDWVLR